MLSQFKRKLACIDYKSIPRKSIFLACLLSHAALAAAPASQQPKTAWYRYYDSKGVANISTSVTPNHIRYGYEALDQNMQVIKRNKPYNAEADIRQAPKRAAQARQIESDARLKRAYNNSRTAVLKKNDALTQINKQLAFQQDQLKQLQNDRILFVRQEREHFRKGEPVPAPLKAMLANNQKNIVAKKDYIQSLQNNYRTTAAEYNSIISRLKAME